MQLRYSREFPSGNGVVWRVDLLEDRPVPFASVGTLELPFEEPLLIEWNETGKEEVMCGSVATLRVLSPGDRTFQDLYTIEPGCIRLDVYRGGLLWWSGMLDPEFYEEPYQDTRDYVVTLTFSDFGVLDRLKYDLSDMRTFREILDYAVCKSGINHGVVDSDSHTSLCFDDGETKARLEDLSVRSDNFYDEEGEPCTLKEVVEGILRPLAMRMVQRAGNIYIYDLNGLHRKAMPSLIRWTSDSQTMGTDKVANNVKVTFSPYAEAVGLAGDLKYGGEYDADCYNLSSSPRYTDGGDEYYSYGPFEFGTDKMDIGDFGNVHFTIFTNRVGDGLAAMSGDACFFHILPMVNGPSEDDGVAWGYRAGVPVNGGLIIDGVPVSGPQYKLNKTGRASDRMLMRSLRFYIPKLDDTSARGYYLRLTLDMLLDSRYNPFTDGGENNRKKEYEAVKNNTSWVFVPVAVNLVDSAGNAVYHYSNKGIAESAATGSLMYARGEWVSGPASFGDAWLEYYKSDTPKGDTGVLGWKKNRHCIGRPDWNGRWNEKYCGIWSKFVGFQILRSFSLMDDGEYIPYPPDGGYVEVTVYAGVNCHAYGEHGAFGQTEKWDSGDLWDKVCWHLYKAPEVEIVKNNLVFDQSEMDDIEYSGYINKSAKEPINIDTICGTTEKVCPTAKGVICRSSDGMRLRKLHRAGVTDHPEKLLIGTLYSQFAGRMTKLSGECEITPAGLCKYTEANQPGKFFIMVGETQNVREDCTDATFVEFNPDEYDSIEEVK